jgi:phosphoesterase RecJ-like protein
MQEPGFVDYIGDSVVVIGHHNADPDAVGAAQGISELVERLKPGTLVEIVMHEDISSLSMKIIDELGLDVREKTSKVFDTVIVVDSGGLNQLSDWEKAIKADNIVTILIDHHTKDDNISGQVDLLIHDEAASATCEMVYRLYEKYSLTPSLVTSKAMLAGILFDTKYLSLGNSETFKTVSRLLENIGDISEVRLMLQVETDVSERIARLKMAQRSELHRIGDWLIVFSEVGSYQASGARALISLGADIAVVIGSDKDELRASIRSTQALFDETGLHLGELLMQISAEFGGAGSGHPTAAGYNGLGSLAEFKKMLLNKISRKIV